MAEIVRSREASAPPPAPGLQAVQEGITRTAEDHPIESIQRAIQSFSWAQERSTTTDSLKDPGKTSIAPEGFVDSPNSYFAFANQRAADILSAPDGIVSLKEVASKLGSTDLRFAKGVESFLQSGIQEALAGLKIKIDPNFTSPGFPEPLDELLKPEGLKNPDRTKLQASIRTVNEMFSTLGKMQNTVNDLRVGALRFVRA